MMETCFAGRGGLLAHQAHCTLTNLPIGLRVTLRTVDDGDLLQLEGVVLRQVLLDGRQDVVRLAARQQPQPRRRAHLDRRLCLRRSGDALL